MKLAVVVNGDTYKWYDIDADEFVAGESTFTPTKSGQYKVLIKRDSETLSDYCIRWSELIDTNALSNADFSLNSSISVYPNPSSDVFFINSDVNGTLIVQDMPGKVIQSQK